MGQRPGEAGQLVHTGDRPDRLAARALLRDKLHRRDAQPGAVGEHDVHVPVRADRAGGVYWASGQARIGRGRVPPARRTSSAKDLITRRRTSGDGGLEASAS